MTGGSLNPKSSGKKTLFFFFLYYLLVVYLGHVASFSSGIIAVIFFSKISFLGEVNDLHQIEETSELCIATSPQVLRSPQKQTMVLVYLYLIVKHVCV